MGWKIYFWNWSDPVKQIVLNIWWADLNFIGVYSTRHDTSKNFFLFSILLYYTWSAVTPARILYYFIIFSIPATCIRVGISRSCTVILPTCLVFEKTQKNIAGVWATLKRSTPRRHIVRCQLDSRTIRFIFHFFDLCSSVTNSRTSGIYSVRLNLIFFINTKRQAKRFYVWVFFVPKPILF